MSFSIAIIGSGPSGFYLAELLNRKLPEPSIDIIERLPTPFGLVRAGVAPDHMGTKNTSRQFEKTLANENIRFQGNLEVGKDIQYEELKAIYDLVIIATGAYQDKTLGLKGDHCDGIYGSAQFTGWYNGHPDHADLSPAIGSSVAIIGNGNVALDIARMLAKSPDELAEADIPVPVREKLRQSHNQLKEIWIIGRRGPAEASFTPYELEELGQLNHATPIVQDQIPEHPDQSIDPREARSKQKNLEILQSFADNVSDKKAVRLNFLFNYSPLQLFSEDGQLQSMELSPGGPATDEQTTRTLPVQTIITAIGYESQAIKGVPFDPDKKIILNSDGKVEQGVYTSGWCKRGPNGVIPANKADAMAVVKQILQDIGDQPKGCGTGPAGLDELIQNRNLRVVRKSDWDRLNRAETERAGAGQSREKFTSVDEMLTYLDSTG